MWNNNNDNDNMAEQIILEILKVEQGMVINSKKFETFNILVNNIGGSFNIFTSRRTITTALSQRELDKIQLLNWISQENKIFTIKPDKKTCQKIINVTANHSNWIGSKETGSSSEP